MLIKEMLSIGSVQITADAKQCMTVNQASAEQSLQKGNLSWAVMVKANKVSRDGWYWSSPNKTPLGNPPILDKSAVTTPDFFSPEPVQRNPNWYPTGDLFQPLANGATKQSDVVYPYNMYGAYCVNCHAMAQNESTYASIDNLLTDGIQYKFFPSSSPKSMILTFSRTFHNGYADPHDLFAALTKSAVPAGPALRASSGYVNPFSSPRSAPSPAFLNFYKMLPPLDFTTALQLRMPAETYDHQMSGPQGPGQFVTSDQCIGCHDATQNNSATPNMLITDKDNGLLTVPAASSVNFSPYGEWRVSPMGLAGRDPIFFSQLQSETNTLPKLASCIENTCLHCHGVMGQRQYALDNPDPTAPCRDVFAVPPPPTVPFVQPFDRQFANQWQGTDQHSKAKYVALARAGF
jgi:cytochrome c553